MNLTERISNAWNAFTGRDPTKYRVYSDSYGYYYRPDRVRLTRGNDRSIITAVYNRIALDVAAIKIENVRLDNSGRYKESIQSSLNYCLTLSPNKDQTARAFIHDVVMSMFDEGCVAIVPIDTDDAPDEDGNNFNIYSMRVGKIVEWMPNHVKIQAYNDRIGDRQEIVMPKSAVAIIENPFYSVMNEPNSILQRLIRKLNLLDVIDEQSGSGKLDLIIQLPYVVKSELRKQQAETRRQEIERQLSGSKLGIAYTDGTERIVQLNRSVENNLMTQIEYLTSMLYSQLAITSSILDGSADDKTMLNYNNRTVEPIIAAICDEMNRKFLSDRARSRNQSIMYFQDPFRLVPVSSIAEIADKFTRNEIMSSNEIRQVIGMRPISDEKADELRNKNLSPSENQTFASTNEETGDDTNSQKGEVQNDL